MVPTFCFIVATSSVCGALIFERNENLDSRRLELLAIDDIQNLTEKSAKSTIYGVTAVAFIKCS